MRRLSKYTILLLLLFAHTRVCADNNISVSLNAEGNICEFSVTASEWRDYSDFWCLADNSCVYIGDLQHKLFSVEGDITRGATTHSIKLRSEASSEIIRAFDDNLGGWVDLTSSNQYISSNSGTVRLVWVINKERGIVSYDKYSLHSHFVYNRNGQQETRDEKCCDLDFTIKLRDTQVQGDTLALVSNQLPRDGHRGLTLVRRGTEAYSLKQPGQLILPDAFVRDNNTLCVTKLANDVFSGCLTISSIVSRSLTPPVIASDGHHAFDSRIFQNTVVYVPKDAIEAYRQDNGWGQFAHIYPIVVPGDRVVLESEPFRPVYVYNGGDSASLVDFQESPTDSLTLAATVDYAGLHWRVTSYPDQLLRAEWNVHYLYLPATLTNITPNSLYRHHLETVEIHPDNPVYVVRDKAIYRRDDNTLVLALAEAVLPDTLRHIASHAFCWEEGFHSLTLPASVEQIDSYALRCSDNGATLSMLSAVPPVIPADKRIIDGSAVVDIRVSVDNYNAYVAAGWNNIPNARLVLVTDTIQVKQLGTTFSLYYERTADGHARLIRPARNYPQQLFGDVFIQDSVQDRNGRWHWVTEIAENALRGCSMVDYVRIPDHVLTIARSAFAEMADLTEARLGKSVTTIADSAFYECSALGKVDLNAAVNSIGVHVWEQCHAITAITVDQQNTTYYAPTSCNAIVERSSSRLLVGCPKTRIVEGIKSLSPYSMHQVPLSEVVLPASLQSIGEHALDYSLLSTIKCLSQQPPTLAPSAFDADVYNSSTVYVPRYSRGAYQRAAGWASFRHIEVPTDTLLRDQVYYAIVSDDDDASYHACVVRGPQAPQGRVTIADTVRSDEGSSFVVTEIADSAFAASSSLTAISVGGKIERIGTHSFVACTKLQEISVQASNEHFESRGCNAIFAINTNHLLVGCRTTTIPDSTSVIGTCAFYAVPLDTLSIPARVNSIMDSAFSHCTGLSFIHSYALTPPACGKDVWESVPNDIAVYVPQQSVDSYRQDPSWAYFSDIRPWYVPGDTMSVFCHNTAYTSEYTLYFRLEEDLTATLLRQPEIDEWRVLANGDVEIPDTVENYYPVTSIADSALYGCREIYSLSIGRNMRHIGAHAFEDCRSLERIYIEAEPLIEAQENSFTGINPSIPVELPHASYSLYMDAEGWRYFDCLNSEAYTLHFALCTLHSKVVRVMRDGVIYIEREGVRYDLMGRIIK